MVAAAVRGYVRRVAGSEPGVPAADALTAAVKAALAGAGTGSLGASVQRLIAAYRAGEVPPAPVITSRIDAAAYAAYRMPATAAATAAALREVRLSLAGWAPSSLIDFGAGTGGSAWAVDSELPSIGAITLLEQSPDAIRLGRAIFAQARSDVLRSATWRQWQLGDGAPADDGEVVRMGLNRRQYLALMGRAALRALKVRGRRGLLGRRARSFASKIYGGKSCQHAGMKLASLHMPLYAMED